MRGGLAHPGSRRGPTLRGKGGWGMGSPPARHRERPRGSPRVFPPPSRFQTSKSVFFFFLFFSPLPRFWILFFGLPGSFILDFWVGFFFFLSFFGGRVVGFFWLFFYYFKQGPAERRVFY